MLNGTRGVIDSVDLDANSFSVTTDSGEKLSIPFSYLEAGHLTHGYATTIHKAQGLTVDRCLVLFDDTGAREHAYTALSRGRHANDIYTVAPDRRAEERHAAEIESDGLELYGALPAAPPAKSSLSTAPPTVARGAATAT